MLAVLLTCLALAYETDQLSDRAPLRDAAPLANAWMDDLLDRSAAHVNERTRCAVSEERAHALVAKEIGRAVSRRTFVPGRGLIRGMGHGGLGAFLETADVERREAGLFDRVRWWDSVVLANAGAASTVQISGVLVGTDKIDHFLSTGFAYWLVSREGERPGRAVTYGTRTERTIYGLLTSKTFSFADLAANIDGYRFYASLLGGPEAMFTVTPGGCIRRQRPFSWAEWVRSDWDEVLNPSVYSRRVQRRIWQVLDDRQEAYCAVWRASHPEPTYTRPPYVDGKAPPRTDPFGLETRCREDP